MRGLFSTGSRGPQRFCLPAIPDQFSLFRVSHGTSTTGNLREWQFPVATNCTTKIRSTKASRSLPYGCSLTVSRDGMRQRNYWEPKIRAGSGSQSAGSKQVFEALRELLINAVECRMFRTVSLRSQSRLSGGLDSSGITAIAARYLAKKGQTPARFSLAFCPVIICATILHRTSSEFIPTSFGNGLTFGLNYVSAPGRGPFDALGDPEQFVVSPVRASVSYLHDAFKEGSDASEWGTGAVARAARRVGAYFPTPIDILSNWPQNSNGEHLIRELRKVPRRRSRAFSRFAISPDDFSRLLGGPPSRPA